METSRDIKITSRQLAIIVTIELISVAVWALLMLIDSTIAGSIESIEQAVDYVTNPSIIFYFTYFNAVVFTCIGAVMFFGLYLYFQSKKYSLLNSIGLIFVPIYAVLNIFAYGSQITIIPALIPYLDLPTYQESARFTISMLIQVYPGTIASIINLCAYGFLGIPSVIFGIRLIQEGTSLKRVSGQLLSISGIFCFISIGEILLGDLSIAGLYSLIGGFLTLFAEGSLAIALLKE